VRESPCADPSLACPLHTTMLFSSERPVSLLRFFAVFWTRHVLFCLIDDDDERGLFFRLFVAYSNKCLELSLSRFIFPIQPHPAPPPPTLSYTLLHSPALLHAHAHSRHALPHSRTPALPEFRTSALRALYNSPTIETHSRTLALHTRTPFTRTPCALY
jgi:hypothetical protein